MSLAEDAGLTAKDCHAIATLLVSKRKPDEALSWVGRGFEIDKQTPHGSMASYDLAKLKSDLLTKLGRGDEALDAASSDYRKHPSTYTYDDLMKCAPKGQRKQWHEKAIEAAMGADLRSIMDLLLKTKELDRLAELVHRTKDDDPEELSHFAAEPVAKKFEKAHPDLAARLWRAQGLRIANTKKSKYYGAALSNFERAKRCFERARLEGLEEGVGPSDEPLFLERAKARWSAKERSAQ